MPRAWLHVLLMPCGFCLGGVVGAVGAPAWEMAIVFVAFFGGICGALTATLAAAAGRSRWYAPLAAIVAAGTMALLASSNPTWVVIRCTIMVAAAGLAGTVLGRIANLAFPAPDPLSVPPQQPPDQRV
ncbi:MAG: hypothetical protein U0935_14890 [Pirellulales bacterium]